LFLLFRPKIDGERDPEICMVYRLELWPTAEGSEFYTNALAGPRSNDNAGVDLFVVREYLAQGLATADGSTLLDLGVRARLVRTDTEEEVHYWLCPRSSIMKTGMIMANSQGVIDRTYRGTLMAPVYVVKHGQFVNKYPLFEQVLKGERHFQIVAPDMGWISEVRIVTSLPETVRGAGGFGSTGQ
jgi:dUTP pyrophosphatase